MKTKANIGKLIAASISGLAIVAAGAAFASKERSAENDALKDLKSAKISLTEAISRSQAQFGGVPVRAELDNEDGKPAYEIELVNGAKVLDVRLDAVTGETLSSQDDKADGEQESERD
ncbi:MAG: PepSY domain-containing protein [Pseudomonadota bacterium]